MSYGHMWCCGSMAGAARLARWETVELNEESAGAEGPVGREMCESVVRRYAIETMCLSRRDTNGAIAEMWDLARTPWETEDPAVAGLRFKYGRGRWASVGRLFASARVSADAHIIATCLPVVQACSSRCGSFTGRFGLGSGAVS